LIRFEHVSKQYGRAKVLDDISFEIKEGEFAVLIGPSGCGKTTTLKTINRLIEPDAGQVWVNEQDIARQSPVALRRGIGYVIQQIGLFPNMTVAQNIAVVPKLLKYSRERCDQVVRELLAMVDMPYEENAHKYPAELSGGQQQRIGVLRALAASPPIVLMDEPFGALDPVTRDSLQEEIKGIQKKLKKTIVFVTHDMDEALRLADTVIFMDKGKILQMASPEEMLQHPASPIITAFMGKHIAQGGDRAPMVAEDFMKKRVLKAPKTSRTLEGIKLMSSQGVNSLVVVEEDGSYLGTVTVEDLRTSGKAGQTIEALVSDKVPTVHRKEDARLAFDSLQSTPDNFVVVLNDNRTVAGLITRTSMAKALGEAMWGELV